jgi:hypothetical protein
MQYDKHELPAGDDQLIELYVNHDTAASVDVGSLMTEVAADAAERRLNGWRLSSVSSIPLRQTGTAGNVLFQSGGQYVTQLALVVLYVASPPEE